MANADPQSPYIALARKYRPRTFAELIGQDPLVKTFSNALLSKRLHHAYLLTGIRGTGKTTAARLLARAINCTDRKTDSAEPCGVCRNCLEIEKGAHMDVQEMDGASYTSVDHIRQILENVPYAPSSALYKVYIIDEVHMLSTSAFNALLKTLEEPPAHVKFLFATTEVEKLPITILSRCQRIDLRRVSDQQLIEHLKNVCDKESIPFKEDALAIIAFEADGSVRDSLSLLDQARAHADGLITQDIVRSMLGLANQQDGLDILDALFRQNVAQTIEQAHRIYAAGTTAEAIVKELLRIIHLITQKRLLPDLSEDIILGEQAQARLEAFAKDHGMAELNLLWQMLLKGFDEIHKAPYPLLALEMLLYRLLFAEIAPSPEELLATLKQDKENEKKKTLP